MNMMTMLIAVFCLWSFLLVSYFRHKTVHNLNMSTFEIGCDMMIQSVFIIDEYTLVTNLSNVFLKITKNYSRNFETT